MKIARTSFINKMGLRLTFIITFVSISMLHFHIVAIDVVLKIIFLFFYGLQDKLT